MRLTIAAMTVGTALAFAAAPVSAATITGETVSIDYLHPDTDSVRIALGTPVVGDGIEATLNGAGAQATIDLTGSSVTVTALSSFTPDVQPFNGIRISDILGAFGDFLSFSLVTSTFSDVELTFDDENLFLNFAQNGSISAGDSLTADFTVAPVPLPASGLLLIAGLGALGAMRRFTART